MGEGGDENFRKIADVVYGWSLIEIVPVMVNIYNLIASFQTIF